MTEPKRIVPITMPFIGEEEIAAVQVPLRTGWLVQGPFVQEFERKFASYSGSRYGVATTSCTTALHLGVVALGLKPGDEVLVPAFTWVSTANVVEYAGAKPVFCDVDLATYNIDVADMAARITPRTVGIIPVHLFGLCADMDPILSVAREHGLWVLEDAACGLGARYGPHYAGTMGDAGCFSFHPRKSITTGEGGMLLTSSDGIETSVRRLRDHGASRSDLDRHSGREPFELAAYEELGYNYRMTDIQAAVGSAQIDRIDWIVRERRRCAEVYGTLLNDTEVLTLPRTPPNLAHAYQAYVTLYAPDAASLEAVERTSTRRNAVMRRLHENGIATRPGTHAAALQGYYARKYRIRPDQFPRAFIADRLSLALPLYPQMTNDDLEYVAATLVSALRGE